MTQTTISTVRAQASDSVPAAAATPAPTGERADLVESLRRHRFFLRYTVAGLTDEEAARRTTVSELCLGGLIRHVAEMEQTWMAFVVEGPSAFGGGPSAFGGAWASRFSLAPGQTLSGVLGHYEEVAHRTDELVLTLPSLDASRALPAAPWFEPGARWSARRVLLHLIAETSQHAGHADIIRESLDGAKTMG